MSAEMEEARKRREAAAAAGTPARPASDTDQVVSQISQLAPELVAPLVVFLCTDQASNINGRDFIVGGNEISLMSQPIRERTIYREGGWDLDSLDKVFASTLGAGVKNPQPPQPAK
jgi:hypothetical protein